MEETHEEVCVKLWWIVAKKDSKTDDFHGPSQLTHHGAEIQKHSDAISQRKCWQRKNKSFRWKVFLEDMLHLATIQGQNHMQRQQSRCSPKLLGEDRVLNNEAVSSKLRNGETTRPRSPRLRDEDAPRARRHKTRLSRQLCQKMHWHPPY